MANLKGDAKIVARQDSQNFAVTVDTLQAFMLAEGNKGHLLPSEDDQFDLGSPLRQWKDLYLTGNSIYLGGIKLSDDGTGQLHVEDSSDPNAEIKFDLSTSFIGDLKDVVVTNVEDGQVLSWNEAAGEWRAVEAVSSSLHFYGVIGTETGETLTPDGNETAGDFYLVHGTHQLTGWNGIADGTEVDNADMVVLGADGTTWQHLNDVIGGGGVTSIASDTDALVVDSAIPSVPRLSINNASTSSDGLMSRQDKVKIDEVDDKYVSIGGDTMTGPLDILARDEVADGENMFAIQGERSKGRNGVHILRAIRKDDGGGDSVRYYGSIVEPDEITTKDYVDNRDNELSAEISTNASRINSTTTPGFGVINHEGSVLQRKVHASLWDEETQQLLSLRTQEFPVGWHDNVKFNFLIQDFSEPENPLVHTASVKTMYKSGGNNEYIGYINNPIKWDDKYIFFPQNRLQDAQIGAYDPYGDKNWLDGEGNIVRTTKGSVDAFPAREYVLTSSPCEQLNTATPLTADNRYVILCGNPTEKLPSAGQDTNPYVGLVDLQRVKDGQEYETFEKVYNGSGDGDPLNRKAMAKTIATDMGGYGAGIVNNDGSRTVYIFQPFKTIKKVVVNDLATLDVTLEDLGGDVLPHQNRVIDGGRIDYKGKIQGLRVYQNRYIIWHATNVGIYSFDTSDESLTLIHDTSDDWLRYGYMRYNHNEGAPEVNGKLYFAPHYNQGQGTYNNYGATLGGNKEFYYPLKMLVVNEDLSVTELPIPINRDADPENGIEEVRFGADSAAVYGNEILFFNNLNYDNLNSMPLEDRKTGNTMYRYDTVNDFWTIEKLPYGVYSAAPFRNNELALTTNTQMTNANQWDYRTLPFLSYGDATGVNHVRKTDFSQNLTIKNLMDTVATMSTTIEDLTARLTALEDPDGTGTTDTTPTENPEGNFEDPVDP